MKLIAITTAAVMFTSVANAETVFFPEPTAKCSQEDINKGLLIGGGVGLVTGLTAGVGTVAGMTVMGTGATVGWAGAMSSPFLTGSTIPVAVGTSIIPTGLGAYTGYVVSCAGEEIVAGVETAVIAVGSTVSYATEAVVYGAYYMGADLVTWLTE